MALEATHIRFALDIKDNYQVQDLKKYISGSTYPDSRYATCIDRGLTHYNGILSPDFAANDFKKGWQAHFICDKILNKIMNKEFNNTNYNNEDWHIIASATKTILDMSDMQKFDIQNCIKYIKHTFSPNNEDKNKLIKYYKNTASLYIDRNKPSLNEYYQMWLSIGLDNTLAGKIKLKAGEFLQDNEMVRRIESLYDEMLKNYKIVL